MADRVVLSIVTAADNHDCLIGVEAGVVHVDTGDCRSRPALAELRRRDTPHDFRTVLVGDVERVKAAAAATHAYNYVDEIAIRSLDDTVVVAVCSDCNNVAVNAVLLERRIRVEKQVRQLGQEFFRHEGPELLAGRCIHCVQIAIIRGRIDDDVRVCLRAAVNDGCWLRVQRVTHLATHGRGRVGVDVSDVLASSEADQLLDSRLAVRTGHAEVSGYKRRHVRR